MPDLLIAAACITGLWLYAHCLRRRYRDMFAIYEMCSPVLPPPCGIGLSHKAEGTGSATRPLGPQSHNERNPQ